MTLKDKILKASRADAIPAGSHGLWVVRKFQIAKELVLPWEGKCRRVPPGSYTQLWCYTTATLHQLGAMVMNDCPDELQTHLNFMMRARGRVLITGLGLGCCLRGALANPAVEHVTVVEKSKSVIRLVWPYIPKKHRITLINADAIKWANNSTRKFDTAWHDLWDNPDDDDPHLALMHSSLILALHDRVPSQGAWNFPKDEKDAWSRMRNRMELPALL